MNRPPSRSGRLRRRSRGQAIAEFALVAPVLLFLLFGVFEAGLLMFAVGSARFAAGEAARQESESGNAANADTVTLQVIRDTALGTTSLAQVTRIDIYRMIEQPDGTLVVDNSKFNRYLLDGTPVGGVVWTPTSRNVTNGQSDFLGVTINYTYRWKSGVILGQPTLNLTQSFYVRLEPQTY